MSSNDLTELFNEISKKIETDYENKNDLIYDLTEMKVENDDTLEEFTELIVQLTNDLTRITNNQMLINYKDQILQFIENNPKNVIDSFIKKAYNTEHGIYRKHLLDQNEDFFLNYENKTPGIMDKLFEFKTFWKDLNTENKEVIKAYLLTICSLADKRFVNHYTFIELKKKYEHKFPSIIKIMECEF